MPRFKPYDYRQSLFVPLVLQDQLVAGSLEHAIHHLIEDRIEEEWFESLYQNDETGRPAYSPKLLLKVILFGYSRGMLGSRRLETACRENITFMALCCGIKPDHSTIADFVTKLQGRIEVIFAEVLLICHEEGLLSGTHFSLDGLKLSSNAAKESSGTFKDLRLKKAKLERKLVEKLAEHRRQDRLDKKREDHPREKEKAARQASLQRLRSQAERIGRFLKEHEPRQGARKEVQSNVTDNDSCKMQTSHGVIQGYNAQALVDEQQQIIVQAQASGSGQDYRQMGPMLMGACETLELAGLSEELPLEGATLSADANYHSEENLRACEQQKLDAYIPDVFFRMRDERFADREHHKAKVRGKKKERFELEDFTYEAARDCYICPQGKELRLEAATAFGGRGHLYRRYEAARADCLACPLQKSCVRRGGQRRTLHILKEAPARRPTLSQVMREKIDQPEARKIYARRLAIVEPVFANLRSNKGMNRFTYRGSEKVNIQWMLYCLVHNLEKIARYGKKWRSRLPLKGLWVRVMAYLGALHGLIADSIEASAILRRFRSAQIIPQPVAR